MTCEKDRIKYLLWAYYYKKSQKSFREFYNSIIHKLISFAMIFMPSRQSAEDVVSEVFVKLFKMGARATEIDDIKYYLYRSVKNQCITVLNSKMKMVSFDTEIQQSCDLAIDISDPYQQYLNRDLQNELQRAINSLPPQKKTIYQLIVLEGLKYKEVAVLLNLAVKTVENHMLEATRIVRKKITAWLEDNPDTPLPQNQRNARRTHLVRPPFQK